MPSSESLSSCDKDSQSSLIQQIKGVYKVKYNHQNEWDFMLETPYQPIDASLVLPHYRAHNQPVDHRLGMLVAAHSQPVKVKVCRHASQRSRFFLEVQSHFSDITVWLPSDFHGHISHTGKAAFSAGFINRIMKNVRLNEDSLYDPPATEDEVVVFTQGKVTFRMWDVSTSQPESVHRETFKRMFGCKERSPETTIDWDFLLEG